MNNVILTITGPSGSGKSTLEKRLKEKGFQSLISTTTRQPRAGEIHGQHYYFVSKDEFKSLRDDGAFVEEVTFDGEFYGLYKSEVTGIKHMSMPAVIVVEPHGKQQIRDYAKSVGIDSYSVFIDVDNQTQMERLMERFAQNMAKIGRSSVDGRRAYNQLVTDTAKRMVIATTEERMWLANAYERENGVLVNYDMVLQSFDAETERVQVQVLTNAIDSILAAQPQVAAA